jgi:adenylate cyclase
MSFIDDMKHPNVFRAGATYLALSWLILQCMFSLTPLMDWPEIFAYGILFMLIPGFPIILMLAGLFELTHKKKKTSQSADEQLKQEARGVNKIDLTIMAIVCLALLMLLVDVFILEDGQQTNPSSQLS